MERAELRSSVVNTSWAETTFLSEKLVQIRWGRGKLLCGEGWRERSGLTPTSFEMAAGEGVVEDRLMKRARAVYLLGKQVGGRGGKKSEWVGGVMDADVGEGWDSVPRGAGWPLGQKRLA